jgi:ABC-2 type transport system permease protein
MAGTLTVFRKEIADHFGSKRFLILFGLVVVLSALSAYQGVDFIRESTEATFISLFSGTMMSYSFVQIMVFFGPLLGLAIGFDAINKERTNGTLSILLGQPIFRDSVINGKFLAGAAALTTVTVGTIGIMCGMAIPMLGFGPTLDEALRVVVLMSLTILYLIFWLSLGLLYSVLTKKTATSILASIATWLVFSIIISILASAITNMLIPLQAGGFRGGGEERFEISSEFMETMQKRNALSSSIEKLSPTNLYSETASAILGAFRGGFGVPGRTEFERTVTLGEALAANWANIATIAVCLVVCFAASYMKFLRSEIRPGE